jgi:dTDP-4-amino-4,6-dideoxygalactose transaminase
VRIPLLDLAAEDAEVGGAVRAAIADVLASRRYILGPHVERFEAAMAAYLGVPHAVGVASGTDALVLALGALGVGPGDAVLTTPFSFFATASAIVRVGGRPLFADIDPATFNLDPAAAATVLARHAGRVKAILPVHLFGRMAPLPALGALAARYGCALVEDAAQALGARGEQGAAGTIGTAGCLSFYPTKNLGGIGDGGMVLTAADALAARVRRDRHQGQVEAYVHDALGLCSRLDALQAAVLAAKLPHLDAWSARRRAAARCYDDAFRARGLAGRPGAPLVLPELPGTEHVFHQYVLRVHERDALRAHLAAAGVGSGVYYHLPLHRQPALGFLGHAPGSFPQAERAAAEVLALPMHAALTAAQVAEVVDAVAAFYASRR